MAITQSYNVTQTVGTTEWSFTAGSSGVATQTTAGVYQFFMDCGNLAAGDVFRVRIYEKVGGSGDTQRLIEEWMVEATAKPLWVSPALILMHGWDFTVTKISGTDRSIKGSVRQIA